MSGRYSLTSPRPDKTMIHIVDGSPRPIAIEEMEDLAHHLLRGYSNQQVAECAIEMAEELDKVLARHPEWTTGWYVSAKANVAMRVTKQYKAQNAPV